nr:hypothetical protein [Actinomycetota bacterium]
MKPLLTIGGRLLEPHRLLYYNVGQTFAKLARRAGLTARSGACRPRPHDLRHSFAVATLLDWCRNG